VFHDVPNHFSTNGARPPQGYRACCSCKSPRYVIVSRGSIFTSKESGS
jgi:hypothetical protein